MYVTEGASALRSEPSGYGADALLGPRGQDYPHRGTAFWTIASQYAVVQTAPTPDRWVWVQWQPDSAMVEIGCTMRFALFHWGPDPELVASTDAGCDV